MSLEEKISKLRTKLNKYVSDEEDYSVIYQVSVELDELITKYYAKYEFGVVKE